MYTFLPVHTAYDIIYLIGILSIMSYISVAVISTVLFSSGTLCMDGAITRKLWLCSQKPLYVIGNHLLNQMYYISSTSIYHMQGAKFSFS